MDVQSGPRDRFQEDTMHAIFRLSCVLPAVASLAGACATAPTAPWQVPPGAKIVTVNGYPMAYTERGSGPPLALTHGAANDFRYWQPQIESLSNRFHVVAVSLRHHYPERWNGDGED